MDKQLVERVARAIYEALKSSPVADTRGGPWDTLHTKDQSEYRAVAHSALTAAGSEHVWIVTDETDCSDDERQMTSVIVVADSREAALAYLKENYGGIEDCIWQDHGEQGWRFSTRYGEYTWVMVKQAVESSDGRAETWSFEP